MRRNESDDVSSAQTKYTVHFNGQPMSRCANIKSTEKPKNKSESLSVKKVVKDISTILEDLIGHLHLIEKREDSYSDVIPTLEKDLQNTQRRQCNTQKNIDISSCSLSILGDRQVGMRSKTGRTASNKKCKVLNTPKLIGTQRNGLWTEQPEKKSSELSTLTPRRPLSQDPLGSIRREVKRAIRDKKTFTVRGVEFQPIRRALLNRGWVEKIHFFSHRSEINQEFRTFRHYTITQLVSLMRVHDASNICNRLIKSKLLAHHQVDFYWALNNDIFKECPDNVKLTKINMFKRELSSFITREIVYNIFKNTFWFQIPSTSNTNIFHHPRTYNLNQNVDTPEFIKDFSVTASMSLLKWVVKNSITRECKIVSSSGKVSMAIFDFAVNECYKFIKLVKQEDITACEDVLADDWNEFLDNFYKILHQENHFRQNSSMSEVEMIRKSNYILGQLKEYWPFLEMDGLLNIWILKPANGKPDRGFHIVHKLDYVLDFIQAHPKQKYVIQKYIERPLLIHNTRFDIKLWFLISNSVPLKIWIYEYFYVCFNTVRTRHDLELQVNSIMQTPCEKNFTDFTCPHDSIWDNEQFKKYLSDIGYPLVYDDIIYPGMKYCIITAILLQQNRVFQRRNCFKLYRGDFLLTEDFQPWLLKINDNPILSVSTPFTTKIYPVILEDVIKVVVDHENNSMCNTGGFEAIYEVKLNRSQQNEGLVSIKNYTNKNDYFYTPPLKDIYNFLEQKSVTPNLNSLMDTEAADCIKQIGKGIKKTLEDLLPLLSHKKKKRHKKENRGVDTLLISDVTETRETQTLGSPDSVNLLRVRNSTNISGHRLDEFLTGKNTRNTCMENTSSNISSNSKWSRNPSENISFTHRHSDRCKAGNSSVGQEGNKYRHHCRVFTDT